MMLVEMIGVLLVLALCCIPHGFIVAAWLIWLWRRL